MLDALVPAIEVLNEGSIVAAKAAVDGASLTETMRSFAGRSCYVPSDALKGVADPGAVAISIVFKSIATALSTTEE